MSRPRTGRDAWVQGEFSRRKANFNSRKERTPKEMVKKN